MMFLLGRFFFLPSEFAFAILDDGQSDTLLARKGDKRLSFSNDKNVGGTGGKVVSNGVFEMDDIEASIVLFLVLDDADTTQVVSASDHGHDTGFKFHELFDLVSDKVEFDGVSGLDQRIGVANSSSVMRDEIRNSS